jgi:hypothetical protein
MGFFYSLALYLQLQYLNFFIEVKNMNQGCEVVLLLYERLIQAVEVMILAGQEEVVRVLYFENILELSWLVFYLSFVVNFN